MKAIIGGQVFYKGSIEEDLVVIYDDKIRDIVSVDDFDKSFVDEIITLDGEYLLPGFIDVHIHGYEGWCIRFRRTRSKCRRRKMYAKRRNHCR
jgi:N-acetylglucosamine-6-phosphate deacetylase